MCRQGSPTGSALGQRLGSRERKRSIAQMILRSCSKPFSDSHCLLCDTQNPHRGLQLGPNLFLLLTSWFPAGLPCSRWSRLFYLPEQFNDVTTSTPLHKVPLPWDAPTTPSLRSHPKCHLFSRTFPEFSSNLPGLPQVEVASIAMTLLQSFCNRPW